MVLLGILTSKMSLVICRRYTLRQGLVNVRLTREEARFGIDRQGQITTIRLNHVSEEHGSTGHIVQENEIAGDHRITSRVEQTRAKKDVVVLHPEWSKWFVRPPKESQRTSPPAEQP